MNASVRPGIEQLIDKKVRPRGHSVLLSRRTFCLGAAASLARGAIVRGAQPSDPEVPWLADVQRPPAQPDPRGAVLAPLLVHDGRPITSLDGWRVRRAEIRRAWLEFLKPLDLPRPKPVLEVLAEDRHEGCVRQIVAYESEPGERVEGCLIKPEPCRGKRPGVVVLHPTTPGTFREPAGFHGERSGAFGLRLARLGFVTFSPRCFLWPSSRALLQPQAEVEKGHLLPPSGGAEYRQRVADVQRRHPGTKAIAKMLWDASRGLDVLESLSEVDSGKLGAVGHSLGAKETLYLAAFDERVRAAVFSEGGIGLRYSNWQDPWYLGPDAARPDFGHEHHELLALVAPRAMLIVGGESGGPNPGGVADGDRSWPFVEAVLPVYRLYGGTARIGLLNHHQGHSVPAHAAERIDQWLQTYLA
jgi:dienelactone hydrolase